MVCRVQEWSDSPQNGCPVLEWSTVPRMVRPVLEWSVVPRMVRLVPGMVCRFLECRSRPGAERLRRPTETFDMRPGLCPRGVFWPGDGVTRWQGDGLRWRPTPVSTQASSGVVNCQPHALNLRRPIGGVMNAAWCWLACDCMMVWVATVDFDSAQICRDRTGVNRGGPIIT